MIYMTKNISINLSIYICYVYMMCSGVADDLPGVSRENSEIRG